MRFTIFILIISLLSSCYVYKPLEPKEDEELPVITKQILKGKMYKIQSGGEFYKIKAVNWEGDSLVTHVNFKEENEKKFHKNDIQGVNHRIFSRGRSDATTVGIYGGIAGLILLLFGS